MRSRRCHGGQAVRHDDGRASAHEVLECILHQRLALGVQCACGLVEHQDRCVGEDGAGDGHALTLAAGEFHTALAHERIKAAGQAIDELERVGKLGGTADLILGGVGAAIGYVLADGTWNSSASCGT